MACQIKPIDIETECPQNGDVYLPKVEGLVSGLHYSTYKRQIEFNLSGHLITYQTNDFPPKWLKDGATVVVDFNLNTIELKTT